MTSTHIARMTLHLKETIFGEKISPNYSSDLIELKERVRTMCVNINKLVNALRSHHKAMIKLDQTRVDVAKCVSNLAIETLINDQAGLFPLDDNKNDPEDKSSYLGLHLSMRSRREQYYDRYEKNIICYADTWNKVIQIRVMKAMNEAEGMRRNLDHYESKVQGLRKDVKKHFLKGNDMFNKQSNRLKRNEKKLFTSRIKYNDSLSNLCLFLEEVTDRGWKDVYPIILKMLQLDFQMSCDEYTICSNLKTVRNSLKDLANEHSLTPHSRLEDLTFSRNSN